MENLNYKLKENCEYYVRFASHINEDLKRGWSSWNFGGDAFVGTISELIEEIDGNRNGGEFSISGFGIWIDEETTIKYCKDVVFVDDYEIRELYKNNWVCVDRINAKNGLSAHILPENLNTIADAINLINRNPAIYDGCGDGESFDANYAKVVYSKDNMHIIEIS